MAFRSSIAEVAKKKVADAPPPTDRLAGSLRQFIQDAQDWRDLDRVTDAAEAACKQGKISREDAEDIAVLSIEASLDLPEEIPRKKHVIAEGFFGPDADYWWAALEAHKRGLKYVPRWLIERERRSIKKAAANGAVPVSRPLQGETEEAVIWAEDLLPEANNNCSCCGRESWWTKECGQRVCGVCHPQPKPND